MVDAKENREQKVRDAKRELILDAAREVFSEQGFHEAKLEEVAARAGFSKASLYNYYTDKETLFLSLAVREHGRLAEILESAFSDSASFKENVKNLLSPVLTRLLAQFTFMINSGRPGELFCSSHKDSPERQALLQEFMGLNRRMVQLFESAIELGRKKGEVKSPLDNATLARYFASILRGVVLDWRLAGKAGEIESELKSLMIFVEQGFGLSHPSGKKT